MAIGKKGFFRFYGKEYRELGDLGLPVLVTQLGIITVNFADTMMVGAYGLDELASAAFVNSFFIVAMVMQIGFAAGMTPLIGALYGSGDHRRAGATFRAGMHVNLIVSAGFTAIMGALYFMLGHFGQSDDLLPLIRQYYLIVLASLLPLAVFNCCQQTSNGSTDTAMPMWIILGCNVLNIFGNWVLIFGKFGMPELGLAGAGISTLFCRLAGMTAILTVFRTGRRWEEYRRGWRQAASLPQLRRQVWQTGYPVMVQSGIECFLWSFGAIVSGWFGKVQIAAYQVINTISQLGFMTYLSFGTATSVMVANFNGMKSEDGMRRTAMAGLHLNLLLGTLASLIFLFGGRSLVGVFTSEPAVVETALTMILPLILYQYGDAVQLTYANALRGTSEVRPLLWISIVSYVVVGVPLLLFMGVIMDMKNIGIYYSFSGALITASVLLIQSFRIALRHKTDEYAREATAEKSAVNTL